MLAPADLTYSQYSQVLYNTESYHHYILMIAMQQGRISGVAPAT